MNQQPTTDSLVKVSGEFTMQSSLERDNLQRLFELQQDALPGFGLQWNLHQTVFLRRQSLSRLIYYHELYQKVIDVPGVICEFGVQWGATLSTLINLRGMLEPFNHSRVIYGFDTFEGFVQVDEKDGGYSARGDYSTGGSHYQRLEEILQIQESFSPLAHIKKFELIKGDASETVLEWLNRNPHADRKSTR